VPRGTAQLLVRSASRESGRSVVTPALIL
jgi:hypothetical protein